jgi:hypothetical protein
MPIAVPDSPLVSKRSAVTLTTVCWEEVGEKDTKSQKDKYTLSYQGRVVGQVWLGRSIDVAHDTGGAAVFYSSKKMQELKNKARVAGNGE